MTANYDIKNVDAFLDRTESLGDNAFTSLWHGFIMIHGQRTIPPLNDGLYAFVISYLRLTTWEQGNILDRMRPRLLGIHGRVCQAVWRAARDADSE